MPATDARRSRAPRRELDFFRSLPPTPEAYRSRRRPGRPHARRARVRLRRRGGIVRRLRRGDRDPHDGRRDPPGARSRVDGDRGRHRLQLRLRRDLSRSTRTSCRGRTRCSRTRRRMRMGIRARWDQDGHPERKLWVLGGDGAMYDIGFQSLSRMVASGADIKVLVLDTQVYSNTGGQASTATFGGQVTKLTAFGKAQHGKPERRKELGRILMSHGEVYVAQVSTAHVNHFYRAVMEANEYPGPAVLIAYTPCMPEHGIADDAGARSVKAAVDSRAFPLFTYDPRRGDTIADGSASPATRRSRATGIACRTAPTSTSSPSPAARAVSLRTSRPTARRRPRSSRTRDDRLANWRTLQELAGVGRRDADGPAPMRAPSSRRRRDHDRRGGQAAAARACSARTRRASRPARSGSTSRATSSTLPSATSPLQPRCSFERNPMPPSRAASASREASARAHASGRRPRAPFRFGAIERFVAEWARPTAPVEAPEATGRPGGRSSAPVRRAWHAPASSRRAGTTSPSSTPTKPLAASSATASPHTGFPTRWWTPRSSACARWASASSSASASARYVTLERAA